MGLNDLFSKYGQIYTASFYSKEWTMYTDGREYRHPDAQGDPIVATINDLGDRLVIVARGGQAGTVRSVMSIEPETNRLKLSMTLVDRGEVTAARFFERQ